MDTAFCQEFCDPADCMPTEKCIVSTLVSASEGILFLGQTMKTIRSFVCSFMEGGNIYFEPLIHGITCMPFGHYLFWSRKYSKKVAFTFLLFQNLSNT